MRCVRCVGWNLRAYLSGEGLVCLVEQQTSYNVDMILLGGHVQRRETVLTTHTYTHKELRDSGL